MEDGWVRLDIAMRMLGVQKKHLEQLEAEGIVRSRDALTAKHKPYRAYSIDSLESAASQLSEGESSAVRAKKLAGIVGAYRNDEELAAAANLCLRKTSAEFAGEFFWALPKILKALGSAFPGDEHIGLRIISQYKRIEKTAIYPVPRAERWSKIETEVAECCHTLVAVPKMDLRPGDFAELGFRRMNGQGNHAPRYEPTLQQLREAMQERLRIISAFGRE